MQILSKLTQICLSGMRLTLAFCIMVTPLLAVEPDEVLKDPVLEDRARSLSQTLRCVVCQNQSIDASNAPLARDLRLLLRERLSAGDSDDQAVDYIVARYGNFVLLKPPVQANTLILWLGPLFLLVIAACGFGAVLIRRAKSGGEKPRKLTRAERHQLQTILQDGELE